MNARIIIGANYGDEGKGTIVARYSKQSDNCLNILTNGGSQRAHSIRTKEYGITTFKHFGSGTYHGADNYYSCYFILNPIQFVIEYNQLQIKPKNIYRDPNCLWSTPYDVMFNLIVHELNKKYNTCGMGIWSTIKRYKETNTITFDTFINNLDNGTSYKYLNYIKKYYEKLINIPDNWKSTWNSLHLIENFINDCKFFNLHTIVINNICNLNYTDLIFENGQGLLLSDTGKDEEDRTPSNTGIIDALNIIKDIKNINVTAHYVTRPYLTRHGIGNLTNETNILSSNIKDDTNIFNEYQGKFRYGILDINELYNRINEDVGNINFEIELTHCDEIDRVSEFNNIFNKVNIYDSSLI